MAITASLVHRSTFADALNTKQYNLSAAGKKVALYISTITPDINATNAAYNVGQYLAANEVVNAAGAAYTAGGAALGSASLSTMAAGVAFSGASVSWGPAATINGIAGALIYLSEATTPVANAALALIYLGTPANVNNGTFQIAWNTNIFTITLQ